MLGCEGISGGASQKHVRFFKKEKKKKKKKKLLRP